MLVLNRPPITCSSEERHVTRLTLMDHAASSRALILESGSFARQQVFERTKNLKQRDIEDYLDQGEDYWLSKDGPDD
ncbi:hypothetical protein TNCV_3460591 [Trichonephila clavipes]|nr:hypothetical protein TNCV_3460591 [Trichonephila clavipes]